MKVLLASSEITPFAKTGGLADVCGALPKEMEKLQVEAIAFMPAYRCVRYAGQPLKDLEIKFDIPIGEKIVPGRLIQSRLPNCDIPVYLVDQDYYFNRPELYREDHGDYRDNCERFVFFCRAVLESIRLLGLSIDLVHCNDWQTGLIPAYLKIEYGHTAGYEGIASLFTVHNLAYQGQFWHWDMELTGLDWKYFNWRQMEFYGGLNLLKTGLVFADAINTVSPRYAQEIQTPQQGCGLEDVLRHRRDCLSGILNGIDATVWNPLTDPYLAANYDVTCWKTGKPHCKRDLQRQTELPVDERTPVIGMIGRLAEQKGWDLVLPVMSLYAKKHNVQWTVLADGEPKYRQKLLELAQQYPEKIAVYLGYSDELAHKIEAGADMFLMPSRYEPCGLNQMYSLRYGTTPVVHHTGGLADTVVDAGQGFSADRSSSGANGFAFQELSVEALVSALDRACRVLLRRQPRWRALVETGMRQDWSWRASAKKYVDLYQQLLTSTAGR